MALVLFFLSLIAGCPRSLLFDCWLFLNHFLCVWLIAGCPRSFISCVWSLVASDHSLCLWSLVAPIIAFYLSFLTWLFGCPIHQFHCCWSLIAPDHHILSIFLDLLVWLPHSLVLLFLIAGCPRSWLLPYLPSFGRLVAPSIISSVVDRWLPPIITLLAIYLIAMFPLDQYMFLCLYRLVTPPYHFLSLGRWLCQIISLSVIEG